MGSLGFAVWKYYLATGGNLSLNPTSVLIFGADHGIAESREIARNFDLVESFLSGEHEVRTMAAHQECVVRFIDLGMTYTHQNDINFWMSHGSSYFSQRAEGGTEDFRYHTAMTSGQFNAAMRSGQKMVEKEAQNGVKLLGLSAFGSGSTASAVAILLALDLITPDDLHQGYRNIWPEKLAQTVVKGVRRNPKSSDLATNITLYGGYEHAALLGAILQSSRMKIPFLIDNDQTLSIFYLAQLAQPKIADYAILPYRADSPLYHWITRKSSMEPIGGGNFAESLGQNSIMARSFLSSGLLALRGWLE